MTKTSDLRKMEIEKLQESFNKKNKEYRDAVMQVRMGKEKKTHLLRVARKEAARMATVVREKEILQ